MLKGTRPGLIIPRWDLVKNKSPANKQDFVGAKGLDPWPYHPRWGLVENKNPTDRGISSGR